MNRECEHARGLYLILEGAVTTYIHVASTAPTIIHMALRESDKAGEERKTKTGWMNGADRNYYEIATKWNKLIRSAAGRSGVSRFRDSMYRGTSAKNEAQGVVMDQEKTCTGTLVRLIYAWRLPMLVLSHSRPS